MMQFVGDDRRSIVDQLVSAYDACVEQACVHVVCLVAELGWGKTRLVQEFYSALQRNRQRGERYWPESLSGAARDPMERRKTIYPYPLEPPPERGARMPWLWWGLRCEVEGSGQKSRALDKDRFQLMGHLGEFIAVARRRKEGRELAFEALGAGLGMIPGAAEVLSAAVGAARLTPKLSRWLMQGARRQARKRRDGGAHTGRLEAFDARRDVESELELVRQFVSPKLPLVLVVDDAHHGDPTTVNFLRRLMNLRVPALIVATAWPSELEDQAAAEANVPAADRVTFGGLIAALREQLPERVSRHDLQRLPEPAVRTLIEDVAPATTGDRVEALIENADGDPLVLELQLTSDMVQDSLDSGQITLSPAELRKLPRTFEGLIADRFRKLGKAERRWLGEAAWQGDVFFPEFLSVPTQELDRERLGAFVRLGPDDEVAVGRFIERPVHAAVAGRLDDSFSEAARGKWRAHALEALSGWWRDDRTRLPVDPSTRSRLCGLLVRLGDEAADGGALVDARLIAWAAVQRSFAERDLERHHDELDAAEAAARWGARVDRDAELAAATKTRLAHALCANNEPARAVELVEQALVLLEHSPDAPAWRTLNARLVLAWALVQDGTDLDRARRAAIAAKDAAADDRERIAALRALAEVEDADHERAAALAAIDAAQVIARAIDPPDVELLIDLETDRADLEPYMGSPERWRDLIQRCEAELPAGHWLHRYSLFSLGLALLLCGDLSSAEDVIGELERLERAEKAGDDAQFLRGLCDVVTTGKTSVALAGLAEASSAPYISRSEQYWLNAVLAVAGNAADDQAAEPALVSSEPAGTLWHIAAAAHADLAAGIEQLRTEIARPDLDTEDVESLPVVALAPALLGDWLITTGQPHEATVEILDALGRTARPGLPALLRLHVASLRAALRILEGNEPPVSAADAVPRLLQVRAAMYRAVARCARGDAAAAQAELATARAIAGELDVQRPMLMSLAAAHRTCGDHAEADVWRSVVARSDATPEQQVRDLQALGFCLYRLERYDEAAKVERSAWERAQRLEDRDELTFDVGRNLAITLQQRAGPDDIETAIELRKAIARLDVDPVREADNREDLCSLLGDKRGQALAAAQLVALQEGEARRASLTRLTSMLNERAVRDDLDLDRDSPEWQTALRNLAAVADSLHPSTTPEQQVRDLQALGFCLYRLERYDEAAKVERSAWERAQRLEDRDELTFDVGRNLAITLQQRAGPDDIETAIELRKAIARLDVDPVREADNREDLCSLLGDKRGQARRRSATTSTGSVKFILPWHH